MSTRRRVSGTPRVAVAASVKTTTASRWRMTRSTKRRMRGRSALLRAVRAERLGERLRHRRRRHPRGPPAHAGDLLLAAGHQLLATGRAPPVLEEEGQPSLGHVTEPHPDQDLVERAELGEVVAGAPGGHQRQATRELL